MDKQLIERIALEVAGSITAPFINDESMARFAHALLACIDAERGKVATAWLHDITHNDDPRQHDEALAFTPDAFPMDGCGLFTSVGSRPLFLSQTIPPGYVLVPIELPETARQWLNKNYGYPPYGWAVNYKRLLAAAQGERNAAD